MTLPQLLIIFSSKLAAYMDTHKSQAKAGKVINYCPARGKGDTLFYLILPHSHGQRITRNTNISSHHYAVFTISLMAEHFDELSVLIFTSLFKVLLNSLSRSISLPSFDPL